MFAGPEPDVNVKCHKCSGQIIKSYPTGEVKMRAKVCVWNAFGFFAVCKGCGEEISVDPSVFKSLDMKFTYEVKKSMDRPKRGNVNS